MLKDSSHTSVLTGMIVGSVIGFASFVYTLFGDTIPSFFAVYFKEIGAALIMMAVFVFAIAWLIKAKPHRKPQRYLVEAGVVERVDMIKMDIEGHELPALRGAERALRRFRPRLAISIYHQWEDYFRIPLYLNELGLGYRFYLDNYTISDGETVLYGEADPR